MAPPAPRSPAPLAKTMLATAAGVGGTLGVYAVSGRALSDVYMELGTLGFLVVAVVYCGMWILRRIDTDSRRRDAEWDSRERYFYAELQAQRDEHNREIERRDMMLDRMVASIERATTALEQISSSVKDLRDDVDDVRNYLNQLQHPNQPAITKDKTHE